MKPPSEKRSPSPRIARPLAALAICGLAVLAAAFAIGRTDPLDPAQTGTSALALGVLAVAGLFALWALGPGERRRVLGGVPTAGDLWFGLAVGLCALGLGFVYFGLLRRFAVPMRPALPAPMLLLVTGIAMPLVEETLLRGVLWQALLPIAGSGGAIVVAALLGGALHGPASGVFAFPAQAAAGLLFGWMRRRTGSLAPCLLAHFGLDFLALLLLGS